MANLPELQFDDTPEDLVFEDKEGGFVEELPQMAGGMVGGITGAVKGAAFGPWGAAAGGLFGATLGGMGGEAYKQLYQHYVGSPDAPNTSEEAASYILQAGGEEAVYEIGGQIVGRIAGRAFNKLRPKASEGIDELSKLFNKYGGNFTSAQRTDSWLVHQLDGLTRGSLTGSGIMKTSDKLNEKALLNMQQDLSNVIASTATKNLSDVELGQLFLDTVNKGKAAHKVAVNGLYEAFDDMVPVRVSTNGLKNSARELQGRIDQIAGLGIGDIGKDTLLKVLNLSDEMKFSDAQYLRSTLLDLQRGVKNVAGEEKLYSNLSKFVDEITKAMDSAADTTSPIILDKYQQIKKFARKGYEAFNNDFISAMVKAEKKAPERIGEHIFRAGNVQEVWATRLAIRRAAQFDKTISYDAVWQQLQQGYLEGMLHKATTSATVEAGETLAEFETKSGVASANQLVKYFTDPKLSRTTSAVFSREQRNAIFDFIKTAERVQAKPQGGLGMVMQLAQGGAVAGLATGHVDPVSATSLFIPTAVLAKLMTHPRTSKMLAQAINTKQGAPIAAPLLAKLAGAVYQAETSQGMFEYVEPMVPPMGVTER